VFEVFQDSPADLWRAIFEVHNIPLPDQHVIERSGAQPSLQYTTHDFPASIGAQIKLGIGCVFKNEPEIVIALLPVIVSCPGLRDSAGKRISIRQRLPQVRGQIRIPTTLKTFGPPLVWWIARHPPGMDGLSARTRIAPLALLPQSSPTFPPVAKI
jgi:hypothetical protein